MEEVSQAGPSWAGLHIHAAKPCSRVRATRTHPVLADVRHYATTEFVIGGVTGDPARPQELILGRYASATGEFRVAGRTTPLRPRDAAQFGPALTPAGDEHPWPPELPPSWNSPNREPVAYTRVVPDLVVEARVGAATLAGERWRHGSRFVR